MMKASSRVVRSALCTLSLAAVTSSALAADPRGSEGIVQARANAADAACGSGRHTKALDKPSVDCAIARENAIAAGRFDEALKYAAIGCREHGGASDCRRAAQIPLLMGNEAIAVPVSYAAEVRRLGEHVCLSGVRLKQAYGPDATGRECANLARQFVLASDEEYRFAMRPAARTFYEKLQDTTLAAKLYAAACERYGRSEACEARRHLVNLPAATSVRAAP